MSNRNKNKQGNKKTIIGWLPTDWDIVNADFVCSNISKGTTPDKIKMYTPTDIPFLRVNNLTFTGYLDFTDLKYVNNDTHSGYLNRSKVYPGDILINIVGPPLGKTCLIRDDYNEYNINQAIAFFRPNDLVDNKFFFFWLSYKIANKWLKRGSKQTSGQVNLTLELCRKLPFPLPPLPEQKKIAQILSAWDKAIDQVQKLIAAKKQLKKGLMQQLLTGRVRFGEFGDHETHETHEKGKEFVPDGWKSVSIGEVLKQISRPIEFNDNVKYPLISVRRRSGGLFHRDTLQGSNIATKKLYLAKEGDFLISKMQVVHGAMGLVKNEFDDMYISGSYISLVSKSNNVLYINYFDYLSRMPVMYHEAYISSYGVHIEKMTFNLKLFLRTKIAIPQKVKEQQYIADLLMYCEKEINLLTKKEQSLQQQKKGLMQKLLTGEVRVKL